MNKKIRILFLAADPKNFSRLRLGEECREIKRGIEIESNHDRFEVISEWAVTTRDLQKALRDHHPNVVHFSGHGAKNGISLEDCAGNSHTVPKDALTNLLKGFKNTVSLVFLNACYSEPQVQALMETINFTIGMRRRVGDKAAITFASAFYQGLSYGYPVKEAFEMAINLLELDALPDKDNPILFVRKGVDGLKPFFNQDSPPAKPSSNGRILRGQAGASGTKKDEPKICLWIHGWVKRLYDCRPTVALDWTKYFNRDKRKIPSQRIWNLSLIKDLQKAKKRLDSRDKGAFIDFRGKLPLTSVLAIGAKFPEVGGYSFRAEQPTRGKTVLWRSDATPSKRKFKVVSLKESKDKGDILVALSITGSAKNEVTALYNQNPGTFSAMIYAEPDKGPGDGSLRSDRDAVALAIHAKELIKKYKWEYRASQIHLVIYGPAAYCLFLGQRLNALGKVVTYEMSLKGDYKRSVTLQTG